MLLLLVGVFDEDDERGRVVWGKETESFVEEGGEGRVDEDELGARVAEEDGESETEVASGDGDEKPRLGLKGDVQRYRASASSPPLAGR